MQHYLKNGVSLRPLTTHKIPLGSGRPYIHVLKLNSEKTLYSPSYTRSQLEKDVSKCQALYKSVQGNYAAGIQSFMKYPPYKDVSRFLTLPASFETVLDLLTALKSPLSSTTLHPFALIWKLTYVLSFIFQPKAPITAWNALLRRIGYEVIIDLLGIIFPTEPMQAVFLTKTSYTHVDIVKNFVHDPKDADMSNFITATDGKIYNIHNLPDNLVIDCSNLDRNELRLKDKVITHFPENLTVKGRLNLYSCKVKNVPKKLTCTSLDVPTTWETLPEELYITDTLNLHGKIKHLPKTVTSLNKLNTLGAKLTSLGNLHYVKSLDITHSLIKELPANLPPLDNLQISETQIKELPDNLTTMDLLDIRDTQIKELPNSLKNVNKLVMMHTLIKKLPKDLKILEAFGAEGCTFIEAPSGDNVQQGAFDSTTG